MNQYTNSNNGSPGSATVQFSPEFGTEETVTVPPPREDVDPVERERRKRLPGETVEQYIERAYTDLMESLYSKGLLNRVRFSL